MILLCSCKRRTFLVLCIYFFFSCARKSVNQTSVSVTLFMWSYIFCSFSHVQHFFLCPDEFLLFLSDSGWVCFFHFLRHHSKVVLWERGKNGDSIRGGIKEYGHSLIASRVSLLQCVFLHRPLVCFCLKLLVLCKICFGMPDKCMKTM